MKGKDSRTQTVPVDEQSGQVTPQGLSTPAPGPQGLTRWGPSHSHTGGGRGGESPRPTASPGNGSWDKWGSQGRETWSPPEVLQPKRTAGPGLHLSVQVMCPQCLTGKLRHTTGCRVPKVTCCKYKGGARTYGQVIRKDKNGAPQGCSFGDRWGNGSTEHLWGHLEC